jgi:hypothetical protein
VAVDLRIGSVETTLSATDPEALQSPQLLSALVALVKAELARDRELEAQRASDRGSTHGKRRW